MSLLLGFDLEASRSTLADGLVETAGDPRPPPAPAGLATFLERREGALQRALGGEITVADPRDLRTVGVRAGRPGRACRAPLDQPDPPAADRDHSWRRRWWPPINSPATSAALGGARPVAQHHGALDCADRTDNAEILLQVGAAWRTERDSLAAVRLEAGPALAELQRRASEAAYAPVRDEALVLSGLLLPSSYRQRLRTPERFRRHRPVVFAWLDGTDALLRGGGGRRRTGGRRRR
ncbi:MAG: hypothetical protein R2749_00795 [Acidimicrobiales bacterium]